MIIYDQPLKIELKGTDIYVNGHKHAVSVRKLQKMGDVLLSHVDASSEADFNVYYMYRSVYSNIEMRFDITYIPARILGTEFNKTYGHYHPIAEDDLAYPEVYQVLKGKAMFILQKKNHDGSVNVIIVDATEGDVVLLPPNYGHVTVNPCTDTELILSNIVFNGFESDYADYELNKGAAYYCTADGIIQNTNYIVKGFERVSASDLNRKYGFSSADLLNDLFKNPEKFEFLRDVRLLKR